MRHLSNIKKLSLKKDQRKALLKSLAESLITHEKIKTTKAKAKALRPLMEKMITRAKNLDLASMRFLRRSLSLACVKKLRTLARQRYNNRQGGYLRMIKLPPREADNSEMVIMSFVE